MCTGPATAGDVRAAMPHPAEGRAADPIALQPVDDVVTTTLVDNVYDALLTSDDTITRRAGSGNRRRRRSSSRAYRTSG